MRLKIILLVLLFGFASCQNNDCCKVLDVSMDMSVKSATGSDLLNPDNPESFDENQIVIYHLIEEQFKKDNAASNGFSIVEHDSEYRIQISGNTLNGIVEGTTLIKWNQADTDTLKYNIDRRNNGSYVSISKVWFNNVEMWNDSNDTERWFEIVK